MEARVPRVVGTAAARDQILFVERERFADGERTAFVDGLAGLPPCERARLIDGLPIVQDGGRTGRFEIIGERDALNPLGTVLGDAHAPRACGGVAPVAEMDAGADRGPVGLLSHRELAAGGRRFELGGARLGHWAKLRVRRVSATAE